MKRLRSCWSLSLRSATDRPLTEACGSRSQARIDCELTRQTSLLTSALIAMQDTTGSEQLQRNIEVYLPSSSNKPHHSSTNVSSPEDLKLSADQARTYRTALSTRTSTTAPLLTKKHRDQQLLEKRLRSKPDQCRVKFKFSDGTQVISTFQPAETVADLYAFVQTVLVDGTSPFELEIPGIRRKLPNDSQELWKDCDFGAGMVLQVLGNAAIKSQYKVEAKDIGQAVAEKSEQMAATSETKAETVTPVKKAESDPAPKKIPKWLQKGLLKK